MIPSPAPSPLATSPPVTVAMNLGETVCARFGAHARRVRVTHGIPPFVNDGDLTYYVDCRTDAGGWIVTVRIAPWQIESGSLASPPPVIDASER